MDKKRKEKEEEDNALYIKSELNVSKKYVIKKIGR